MSDAFAIAAVTEVLCQTLASALDEAALTDVLGGPVQVTSLPLDRVIHPDEAERRLNLFLFQATPGSGRHDRPPAGNAGGRSAPPLALDLLYLMTSVCAEELHAEIVLGHALRALHGVAIIDRATIQAALSSPPGDDPGVLAALAASGLADQAQSIRVVPEIVSATDLAHIWSAFGVPYRTTVACRVSVVLIGAE